MTNERIHAPDLTGARDWFNVPGPLSMRALRGKVVLLDFWTYGCINCMHILPDLRRLEEKYRDELVVVGIHSAKFANERKSENIRRILVRYDIDHPVANDADFAIWRSYGARAWPTQVLIDPEGYVVATASGEGKGEAFDQAIAAVIQVFDEQGRINRAALPLSPERERIRTSTLAFPGKVLADAAGQRMFIADSNHPRVLVAGFDGVVRDVIGGGPSRSPGLVNGDFAEARFYRPQGMALDGDVLYVADTENHQIRSANLTTRRVATVAGTGRQAGWGAQGGAAREVALNSPWDRGNDRSPVCGRHEQPRDPPRTAAVRGGRDRRPDRCLRPVAGSRSDKFVRSIPAAVTETSYPEDAPDTRVVPGGFFLEVMTCAILI